MARPIVVGFDAAIDDRAPVEFGIAAAEFTGAPLIVGTVHAGAEASCPVIVLARGAETGLEALVDEQVGATA